MTDLNPYGFEASEIAVLRAITQGKLPAEVDALEQPEFLRWVLHKSWSHSSEGRPVMSHCIDVIECQTADLLPHYLYRRIDNIPGDYTTLGDNWHAIHNPNSFACSFLPHIDASGVR